MTTQDARFAVGQIIEHRLFAYTGVIFDIDATFQGSEEWYEHVARSRPPKDEPWYHVLVHDAAHTTYVAQRNLMPAVAPQRINHPLTDQLLGDFDGTCYRPRERSN